MKCSICSNEIKGKYCSKCGQYLKNERISSKSILEDLFGNLFSLEKSLFKNIKIALLRPDILVLNYWNGFRGFYYSPGRFLVIASLFFLIQISFINDFFGLVVTSKAAQQFTLLLVVIALLSFLTFILYLKKKKNFYEHLILNVYNVSLWSIMFVPLSVILNLLDTPKTIKSVFLLIYLFLIIVWNSRVFVMSNLKRTGYIIANCSLLFLTVFSLVYFLGAFTFN